LTTQHSANRKTDLIALAAILPCSAALVFSNILGPVDLRVNDALVSLKRKLSPIKYDGPEVVLVGFDEEYLASMPEPFALVHTHLADALDAIAVANPKVIGIDLNLPSKSFSFLKYRDRPDIDFDQELTKGLALAGKSAPVVQAIAWNPRREKYGDILQSYFAATEWKQEASPGTSQGKDPRASVTVCTDPDGIVRSFPGSKCQARTTMPSFATRVLQAMGSQPPDDGQINYALGDRFRYIPVAAIIDLRQRGDLPALKAQLEGKIVLVAAILNYSDRLRLPVALAEWEPNSTLSPGVIVHAQAIRTLAANALVSQLSSFLCFLVSCLTALLWFLQGIGRKLFALVISVIATWVAAWLLLPYSVSLPIVTLATAAVLPLIARLIRDIRLVLQERNRLGSVFRGSVSPRVMEGILAGKLDPKRKGARVHVHIMFADIRGFTTLSEKSEPERVIRILNAYLTEATQAIHNVNGTIDKFLGDGVVAVFGAPEPLADPWGAALSAARDLIARMEALNRDSADYRITPIKLGIGIHAGEAIVGFVGSSERNEFTSIGDTVNVASRIQGLTAELGYPIIASVDSLPNGGRLPKGEGKPLGPQAIKGHTDIDVVGFDA